jgi:hypothetical protein
MYIIISDNGNNCVGYLDDREFGSGLVWEIINSSGTIARVQQRGLKEEFWGVLFSLKSWTWSRPFFLGIVMTQVNEKYD